MPLVDYLTYSAGFVPSADAEAQRRCYAYLEKAITVLDEDIAKGRTQNLVNTRRLFEDIKSMVSAAAGSVRLGRANTFWRYWDKNKKRIVEVVEGTTDEYVFQDRIGELEDGRYIQD